MDFITAVVAVHLEVQDGGRKVHSYFLLVGVVAATFVDLVVAFETVDAPRDLKPGYKRCAQIERYCRAGVVLWWCCSGDVTICDSANKQFSE